MPLRFPHDYRFACVMLLLLCVSCTIFTLLLQLQLLVLLLLLLLFLLLLLLLLLFCFVLLLMMYHYTGVVLAVQYFSVPLPKSLLFDFFSILRFDALTQIDDAVRQLFSLALIVSISSCFTRASRTRPSSR